MWFFIGICWDRSCWCEAHPAKSTAPTRKHRCRWIWTTCGNADAARARLRNQRSGLMQKRKLARKRARRRELAGTARAAWTGIDRDARPRARMQSTVCCESLAQLGQRNIDSTDPPTGAGASTRQVRHRLPAAVFVSSNGAVELQVPCRLCQLVGTGGGGQCSIHARRRI